MRRFPLFKTKTIALLCTIAFCCGCGLDDLPEDKDREELNKSIDEWIEDVGPELFYNTKIAYVPSNVKPKEIYVMSISGSDKLNLTNDDSGNDSQPSWSPDGKKIAFVSDRRNKQNDIYVMNADGTDQMPLTNHPGDDHSPAWSPDGTKIAFVSDRSWQEKLSESIDDIYVMNADGTDQKNLTNYQNNDFSPVWSPDGTKIAFISDRLGGLGKNGIYIMDGNETGSLKLLSEGGIPLTWSPPTKLYPSGLISYSGGYLYAYDPGPGKENQRWLEADAFSLYRELSWSPDGSKIFMVNRRPTDIIRGIYNISLDQLEMNKIGNYFGHASWRPYNDVTQPAWSPFLNR